VEEMFENMETILLVDDELEDLMTMRRALESNGYRVLEAGRYDQAVKLTEQNGQEIDILVTDISLPGTNGCELARYVLKARPNIRLLFVSGHTGAEICRHYGIPVSDLHFMRKPIRIGEFVLRVREILASQQRLQLSLAAG
jgi:two-component system cell cycle sensor histidine kinase/response regulator CckA